MSDEKIADAVESESEQLKSEKKNNLNIDAAALVEKEENPVLSNYDEDRLMAMVRDPQWIFAYWELSSKTLKEIEKTNKSEKKQVVLRIYDVTGFGENWINARSFYDIEINNYTNNWYIKVPKSDRSYQIDLGILVDRISFIQIMRSNMVSVPKKTISSAKKEGMWGRIDWTNVESETKKDRLQLFKKEQDTKKSEELIKLANNGSLEYKPWGSS